MMKSMQTAPGISPRSPLYEQKPGLMNEEVRKLVYEIGTVIHGKNEVVRMAVECLAAGGHLLIEDVPGVGKTTLAFAMARATRCSFRRIQFTSDLLPSDILGTQILNRKTGDFEFRKGPIFANIVLADEINRTNPKTQSALLEAMNEKRVSQEGLSLNLPKPFMLVATQNPVEYHGTFPLPESQLDRFMMSLTIGYPEPEDEKKVLVSNSGIPRAEEISPVLTTEDLIRIQNAVQEVRFHDALTDYLLRLVAATRHHEEVRLGASTRGAMFLMRASRARAYCSGRNYVVPDDIRTVAGPVLAHRIIPRPDAGSSRDIIKTILQQTPVPL